MIQLQHQNVIQSSNEDLSAEHHEQRVGRGTVIINTTIITKCLQTFGTPCSKIRSNLVDNWSNKFLLEFWKNKKLISKFNWWTLSELIKVVWKVLKIGQKIFFFLLFQYFRYKSVLQWGFLLCCYHQEGAQCCCGPQLCIK